MIKFIQTTMVIAVLASLLSGCNTAPRRDPAYTASYPVAFEQPQQAHTGSIYQAGYDITFFEDIKARRVGDILTVQLAESTNASKSSTTDIGRDQSSTITNPTILGATPQFGLPGLLPLSQTKGNTLESSLSSSHEFGGAADSAQSNSLSGDITVTVADVLPNGNLVIRGEKRLNLNQGNEYVKISGIVRPTDVTASNTVPSTKVADATIVYSADGANADANKVGWLSRFFLSAVFPL
ncbi:MAG: flagellar basal body L-ring protein FlgH [Gammaproteobacteria bacterium]|jgi:flagellar L-ring protein precursor FlgH